MPSAKTLAYNLVEIQSTVIIEVTNKTRFENIPIVGKSRFLPIFLKKMNFTMSVIKNIKLK